MTRNGKNSSSRIIVLGLDGMPYSFLMNETQKGVMPHLGEAMQRSAVCRITSAIPPVSSVAWASFATGKNPGEHNIFGFVDRNPETMELFIPTAMNMRAPALWETLSEAGKRVVVANVPMTYPPQKVNGVLIGDFLSPGLEKAVYPGSFVDTLRFLDYRIDVDAWEAHTSLDGFLVKLYEVLDNRFKTLNYLYNNLDWDFLMMVVMETDRLYHFFWEHYDSSSGDRYNDFIAFHKKLDGYIGEFLHNVRENDIIVVLSDHGFCTLKYEFNLNRYLHEQGFLKLKEGAPGLHSVEASSIAYSLIPGRIFINLKGREMYGAVESGRAYESACNDIIAMVKEIETPDSGKLLAKRIFRREEIYSGPFLHRAPDIIILPEDGYEIKGGFKAGELWSRDKFVGSHTYENAFCCVNNEAADLAVSEITRIAPVILSHFGLHG